MGYVSVCVCAVQILDQLTGGGWCNWGAEAVVQPDGKQEIVFGRSSKSVFVRLLFSFSFFYGIVRRERGCS